jgi:hypothetical protein
MKKFMLTLLNGLNVICKQGFMESSFSVALAWGG